MNNTNFLHSHPTLSAVATGVIISILAGAFFTPLALFGPLIAGFMTIRIERGLGPGGVSQAAAVGIGMGAMVGILVSLVPAALWIVNATSFIGGGGAPELLAIGSMATIFVASLFIAACVIAASVASVIAFISGPKYDQEDPAEERWLGGR